MNELDGMVLSSFFIAYFSIKIAIKKFIFAA
jgi:hypothetical protein